MLNVLFKKPELLHQRSIWSMALILPLTLFIGADQAQAQSTSCFRSRDLTPSSTWAMASSGGTFKNGDIVGRLSAYAQFYIPIAHGEVIHVDANGQPVNNSYRAIPLSGMPGLGLVLRWGGYAATTTLTSTGGASAGTIISDASWLPLLRGRTATNYTLTQYYNFELVVIDARLYKGGPLTISDQGKTMIQIANKKGNAIPQVCINGFLDPMHALTGTLQVPELPRPVQPTCRFSTNTLSQRVGLGPVDPGQIATSDTLRPSGTVGQNHFLIEATNCSKGLKMNIYFTDARDSATTKTYALTTNPAVGVRIFYGGEYEPMPFGPAPSGSWIPQRYSASLGPAAYEGAPLTAGFTAQYVRLPNKTEADIKPGPLEADAIFVVVYP